jgi:hypothetical protein
VGPVAPVAGPVAPVAPDVDGAKGATGAGLNGAGSTPMPARATVGAGALALLDASVSVDERALAATGTKRTPIVHLCPGAIVWPAQLGGGDASDFTVPAGADGCPTTWDGKARLGATDTTGAV